MLEAGIWREAHLSFYLQQQQMRRWQLDGSCPRCLELCASEPGLAGYAYWALTPLSDHSYQPFPP